MNTSKTNKQKMLNLFEKHNILLNVIFRHSDRILLIEQATRERDATNIIMLHFSL